MLNTVVVTYQLRPEAREKHLSLIEGIFLQLSTERPDDVEYKVVGLDDGVTFVHISTADTDDGANPLVSLSSFQEFSRDVSARTVEPPQASPAQIIGTYSPEGPALGS
jgi:hypothetical protein